jgi:hypothetical protein
MILEQGRRRLRISDGYMPGGMGCRKIDVIEFIAMARKRGRGSVESDNRFAVHRSETRCRRYARFFPILGDAAGLCGELTPEQREENCRKVAIHTLNNATKEPRPIKAATVMLQTALDLRGMLAQPPVTDGQLFQAAPIPRLRSASIPCLSGPLRRAHGT